MKTSYERPKSHVASFYRAFQSIFRAIPESQGYLAQGAHLLKLLRAEGLDVRVSGDPSQELNFLTRKSLHEWLSDPINMLLVGIPVNIACNLITPVVSRLFAGRNPTHTDVLLEIDNSGNRVHYTCDGAPLAASQFTGLLAAMQERRKLPPKVAHLRSPYPARPEPIFLEHTDRIVGWGAVAEDSHGLRVDDGVITDADVWRRIKEGSLKGLSFAGLVRKASCNICGQSYFECSHIGGQDYEAASCAVHLTEIDLCEISIVSNPMNPLATLHWKGDDNSAGT